jgi:hypothetical protein
MTIFRHPDPLRSNRPQEGKIMQMRERVWGVLGGLVLIALGVGLAWYEGPLLLRDFGIGSNVETATQARLVKGRCKSRLIIFFCDLTIDQNVAGATHQTELNYLFVDMPFTDHNVRLLSSRGDRSIITTDVGQEMLWNRALTLTGMLVFCLAGGVIMPLRKGAARVQGTGRAAT